MSIVWNLARRVLTEFPVEEHPSLLSMIQSWHARDSTGLLVLHADDVDRALRFALTRLQHVAQSMATSESRYFRVESRDHLLWLRIALC